MDITTLPKNKDAEMRYVAKQSLRNIGHSIPGYIETVVWPGFRITGRCRHSICQRTMAVTGSQKASQWQFLELVSKEAEAATSTAWSQSDIKVAPETFGSVYLRGVETDPIALLISIFNNPQKEIEPELEPDSDREQRIAAAIKSTMASIPKKYWCSKILTFI